MSTKDLVVTVVMQGNTRYGLKEELEQKWEQSKGTGKDGLISTAKASYQAHSVPPVTVLRSPPRYLSTSFFKTVVENRDTVLRGQLLRMGMDIPPELAREKAVLHTKPNLILPSL